MLSYRRRCDHATTARRRRVALLAVLAGWASVAGPLYAQEEEESDPPPVSFGAGLQTSFLHREAEDSDPTEHFRVNSLRLYVNGSATSNIKFMVNTDIDYGGSLGAPNSGQKLRDPLILPYEINKTKTFLKQRLALESLQGGAL